MKTVELVVRVVMSEKTMDAYSLRHVDKMEQRIGRETLAVFFRNAVASRDYDFPVDVDVVIPPDSEPEKAEDKVAADDDKPKRASRTKKAKEADDGGVE